MDSYTARGSSLTTYPGITLAEQKQLAKLGKLDSTMGQTISTLANQYTNSLGRSSPNAMSASEYAVKEYLKSHPTAISDFDASEWMKSAPTYDSTSITPLEYPTYTAPERDEERISELRAKSSAAGLRALRWQMNKAANINPDNPNVKRMTLRDALAGYGQGVESIMSAAGKEALSEYNTEYNIKADEAKTNYSTGIQKATNQYQEALKNKEMAYQSAWNTWNAARQAALSMYQIENA